jgi:hypothetical protein
MRFLVDENLPCDLAISARERGLEALWVRDIFPGAKDQVILERLKNTPRGSGYTRRPICGPGVQFDVCWRTAARCRADPGTESQGNSRWMVALSLRMASKTKWHHRHHPSQDSSPLSSTTRSETLTRGSHSFLGTFPAQVFDTFLVTWLCPIAVPIAHSL